MVDKVRQPLKGIAEKPVKKSTLTQEKSNRVKLIKPDSGFLPLPLYKKRFGNPNDKENKKKGNVLKSINGTKGVEMPGEVVDGAWKIERSTSSAIKQEDVVDEVDGEEGEIVEDQIGSRYQAMSDEMERRGAPKGRPGPTTRKATSRSSVQAESDNAQSDDPSEEEAVAGRQGAQRTPGKKGRKRRIEGSGDDLLASESSHVPTSTPKAVGRPKKDILAICAEAQKSFDIATAGTAFFDTSITEVQAKLLARHIVTCSQRLLSCRTDEEKKTFIKARKQFQIIETSAELYQKWQEMLVDSDADKLEEACKFYTKWQERLLSHEKDQKHNI